MSAAKQGAMSRQKQKKGLALSLYFTLFTAIALMVLALPTALVAVVGMVPALVTYIIDFTPGRYALRCVLPLNLVGTVPSLYHLWVGGNDIAEATRLIGDSTTWLIAYGAAAFGWGIFLSLPGLVAAVKMLDADRRVNALRERQGTLIREWGRSIAGENWRGFTDDVEYFDEDDEEAERQETQEGDETRAQASRADEPTPA